MEKPNITEGEWETTLGPQMGMYIICTLERNRAVGVRHPENKGNIIANSVAIKAVPKMIDALMRVHQAFHDDHMFDSSDKGHAVASVESALKEAGVRDV